MRMEFYLTLERLVRDGKPIMDCLVRMRAEFDRIKHPLAPLVTIVVNRMRGANDRGRQGNAGDRQRTLGSEIRGLVPQNESQLIEAGEASGDLPNGLARAAEHVRRSGEMGKAVKMAMLGPVLNLVMLCGLLIFFSVWILPTFETIAPRVKWPLFARNYARLSDVSIPLAVFVLSGLFGAMYAFARLNLNWKGSGRRFMDRNVWPFTTAAQVNSAAMLTSLAGFVAAGVPFATAVQMLKDASAPYMRWIYTRLLNDLREGMRPEEALIRCHIIHERNHWLIKLYGDSSDFAGALTQISAQLAEYTVVRTKVAFSIVGFFVKLVIAGVIVWTFATMFGIVGSIRNPSVADYQPQTTERVFHVS